VLGAAGGQRESIFDREGSEEDPAGLRVGIQHRRVQVRGVGRDPGLSHNPGFAGVPRIGCRARLAPTAYTPILPEPTDIEGIDLIADAGDRRDPDEAPGCDPPCCAGGRSGVGRVASRARR
jgi:hypothetical protein